MRRDIETANQVERDIVEEALFGLDEMESELIILVVRRQNGRIPGMERKGGGCGNRV